MKIIFLFFFLMLTFVNKSLGQISFSNPYDLGMITEASNDYIDVPITNTSASKVFIFRADVDKSFSIRYSSKTILPDSTIYIRIKYNPESKGLFNKPIPIHFSCFEEPLTMEVRGFVESLPRSNNIACPSFEEQNVNQQLNFELTVLVVDEATNEPLGKSQVKLINNGLVRETLITHNNGKVVQEVPLGYYYFVAAHEGYSSGEEAMYVNRNNNFLIIPLRKNKEIIEEEELIVEETQEIDEEETITEVVEEVEIIEEVEIEETAEVVVEIEEEEEIVFVINNESEEIEEEQEDEIVTEETEVVIETEETNEEIEEEVIVETPEETTPEEDPNPDFSLREYKPNNIVFLVDVSASMVYQGKLDILKASMIELTAMLRPQDKITLVSYSSKASVIIETTNATDVDSLIQVISDLEANGFTAGGEGLKLAYAKACNAMIHNGNNEIIMATDGAFNSGGENVYKLAKKYNKAGVKITVIGVKNKKFDKIAMKELALQGGGNYIDMQTFEEGKEMLVDEIKTSSKIETGM
jgi:Ca-activated chloride channel family protein